MQDGMKNKQGQVQTRALLNACKQSELNWSSRKGKVLKCDRRNVLHSVQNRQTWSYNRKGSRDRQPSQSGLNVLKLYLSC